MENHKELYFLPNDPVITRPNELRTLLTILNKIILVNETIFDVNEQERALVPYYEELCDFFFKFVQECKNNVDIGKNKYIMVEGNIGVGKTTILNKITNPNVYIIPEPLKYWQRIWVTNTNGQSLFELFYDCLKFERTPFVCIFQIVALFTRFSYLVDSLITHKNKAKLFISERSFLSDRFSFYY